MECGLSSLCAGEQVVSVHSFQGAEIAIILAGVWCVGYGVSGAEFRRSS